MSLFQPFFFTSSFHPGFFIYISSCSLKFCQLNFFFIMSDISSKPKAEEDHITHEHNHSDASPTDSHEVALGDYDAQPSLMFATLIVFSVTFVGFTFGFDTGTISGMTNFKDYTERFGQKNSQGEYYFTTVRMSLLVAIYSVGAAVGGLGLSNIANIKGRKPALLVYLMLYIIGYLVQITSNKGKWYQMFVGRIITGVSAGAVTTVVPMFGGELAPAKYRGALVSSFQLCITLAIFLGYCVTYATKHHNSEVGSAQWRIPMGLNFAFGLILTVLVATIVPESPRFLIEVGRVEEAKKNIAYVNKVPVHSKFVEHEFKQIEEAFLLVKAAGKASWIELVTGKPKILRRVVMGLVIMALQQFTGINFFFYYGTTIFKSVGMEDSYMTSIILGVINFVFTILSLFLVDRFGRRTTLMVGSIIGAVALYIYTILGVVALYPNGRSNPSSKPAGNAMIFLTCLFIASFAASWGAVCYVILAESFPIRIRSKAMSIGMLSNFAANFLISFFTPFITKKIHYHFGWIFAGCLTFAIFFTYFFIYETKGLTLEQVDVLYADKAVTPWNSSKWTPPADSDLDKPSTHASMQEV